jgi:hypothetical protein
LDLKLKELSKLETSINTFIISISELQVSMEKAQAAFAEFNVCPAISGFDFCFQN